MPNYDPEKDNFVIPDEGACKVQIEEVIEKASKSGNPMLEFILRVLPNQVGANTPLWWYLVSNNDYYNRNLGSVCRAVGINPGGIPTPEKFKGKVGLVQIKHEEFEGKPRAKIHYWLETDQPENRQAEEPRSGIPTPEEVDASIPSPQDNNVPF